MIKLGELNELAYKDLILSINTSSSVGKVEFRLVRNAKNAAFPEGNFKIVCYRLTKYVPHAASSLLELKSEFHNRKLESIKNNPDELILNLDGLRI